MGAAFGALFAILAGALNALQAGTNSTLGKHVGPFGAGLVGFCSQIVVFVVIGTAVGRLAWPGSDRIASVPWWAWFGGVMGSSIVLAQLFLADQLGSAVFMGLTVTAAVVTSLVLDHFGLVGFQVHPVNAGRVAGAVLMVAGLGLIARF